MGKLLRVDEVAERLGLMPSTIRKLIQLHQLPTVRPTKRAVRVREEDVEALIRVGYQAPREDQAPREQKKTGVPK